MALGGNIKICRQKQEVRQSDWIKSYSEDDRKLIENAFRKHIGHPVFIMETLEKVQELLSKKKAVPASEIVKIIVPADNK